MKTFFYSFITVLVLSTSLSISASEDQSLTKQIEQLKQQAISLNRDLFILEEDLLYPPATQIAVYVSSDSDSLFVLDAIKLTLNDDLATHFLYTEKQVSALTKGGVHRLFQGNVKQGEHTLTAYVLGKGPAGRDIKRAVSLDFNKDDEAKAVELVISANQTKEQPEFSFRVIE